MKDMFHIQCHMWLFGGLIECKCKTKNICLCIEGL